MTARLHSPRGPRPTSPLFDTATALARGAAVELVPTIPAPAPEAPDLRKLFVLEYRAGDVWVPMAGDAYHDPGDAQRAAKRAQLQGKTTRIVVYAPQGGDVT